MAKIKKKQNKTQFEPQEEFRTIVDYLVDLYQSYRTQVNVVLTLAVVAVIVSLIYGMTKANKEAKASQMLDGAYSFFNPPAGVAPDYEKAYLAFLEVEKTNSGTLSGATAMYLAGNALARVGKNEEAIKMYDQFLQKYSGEKLLAVMVHQRKGYVYEQLGKREEAVKSFAQAELLGGAGMATLELARLYEQAGNIDDAQKKYRELNEKLPATTIALEAKMKLPPPDLKAPISAPAGTK